VRAGQQPDEEGGALDAKLAAAFERLGQALRVQLAEAAREQGLSPTQAQIVLRLAAAADPPARRIGALAAEFDVTHPTVSDAVSALRRKGLVEPQAAPLMLTARGRLVAARLSGWDARTRLALASLPAARKRLALALLLDAIAALQRSGAITIARMCVTCRHFRPGQHAGARRPHHCALLAVALGEGDLRVDCPEHEQQAA
jgi:DNA-binding MarR family transcriptional regulator